MKHTGILTRTFQYFKLSGPAAASCRIFKKLLGGGAQVACDGRPRTGPFKLDRAHECSPGRRRTRRLRQWPAALAGGRCESRLELPWKLRNARASGVTLRVTRGRASPLARYTNAGTRQRGSVAAPSLPAWRAFQDAGAPRHRARAGVANGTGHGDAVKEQSSMLGKQHARQESPE